LFLEAAEFRRQIFEVSTGNKITNLNGKDVQRYIMYTKSITNNSCLELTRLLWHKTFLLLYFPLTILTYYTNFWGGNDILPLLA